MPPRGPCQAVSRRGKGRKSKGQKAIDELVRRGRSWVPERTVEWTEEGERAILQAPRFQGRVGRAVVDRLGRDQAYRLKLDEFGTAAWLAIDGQRDVGQIAGMMREAFGERAEPAEERLLEFLRRLQGAGCVVVTTSEKRGKGL